MRAVRCAKFLMKSWCLLKRAEDIDKMYVVGTYNLNVDVYSNSSRQMNQVR